MFNVNTVKSRLPCLWLLHKTATARWSVCVCCAYAGVRLQRCDIMVWSEEDAQLSLQTSQAPYIPVEVKHPLWEVKLLMWALVAATNLSSLLSCSSGNSWFLNIRLQVYKNIVWVGALCCLEMSVSVLRKSKRVILLGLGCSKTSVCFMIFSVHCLVLSALIKSFSKWASNSVFSAWPSFSSVNWKIKKYAFTLRMRVVAFTDVFKDTHKMTESKELSNVIKLGK